MWTKVEDTMINLSTLSGITKDSMTEHRKLDLYPEGIRFSVRLYSAGKCWHMFDYGHQDERDACYDKLMDKVISINFKGDLYDDGITEL